MNKNYDLLISEVIQSHQKMLDEFQTDGLVTVVSIAELICESLRSGSCIYICGNGGSAADAQHIAGELVGRFRRSRKALPAIALSTDTSIITAVANDFNYESIFARQVEALIEEGDVLWAFSTSGGSANVVAAAEVAKAKRAKVVAFTGKKETKLEQIADICFCAESTMTARSQEIHQLAYHIICDIVDLNFCEAKK